MKMKLMFLIAALVFSLSLQAGEGPKQRDIEPISATQTVQLVAVIDAIDREARTVTLTGPQGKSRTLQARPDSNNIDKVEVGDKVNVEYIQHMSIEVYEGAEGMKAGSGAMAAEAINKEGETPASMEMLTTVTTAIVKEINIEGNTFKLAWPNGEIQEYEAQQPENLKKAQVGDVVVLTFTEAIAMTLAEVPAE
jgi:hypothetical protein